MKLKKELGFLDLFQIRPSRPMERRRMSKRLKTVNRTYGGVQCHTCVREKYVLPGSRIMFVLLLLCMEKGTPKRSDSGIWQSLVSV